MIWGKEVDSQLTVISEGGLCYASPRWLEGGVVVATWTGSGDHIHAVCARIYCSSPRRTVQCMYSVHGQHRVLSKQ
jgi:hypothetical protein